MLKEELITLISRAEMISLELKDAVDECGKIDVPIENIISVLDSVQEFNAKLNKFIETHSRDGSFTI